MLAVPLAVSVAVFWGSMFVIWNMTGVGSRYKPPDMGRYEASLGEARKLVARWESEQASDADIAREAVHFNRRHRQQNASILVFRGGSALTPRSAGGANPILGAAMRSGDERSFIGRMMVDSLGTGALRAVLMHADYHERDGFGFRELTRAGLLVSVLCSLIVVYLMNRFLTQFVFRHIVGALDTLTDGVRRISGGDLKARIDYHENDEFTPVCRDFNDMASRLLDSVEERERNEAERRELIAGISHDLRTPLTSIKAYVEGLQQGVASGPESEKRYIDTIGNKAADMERIIDNLFLFSKLEIGAFPTRMERVNLADVLADVCDELADEYAAKGLDMTLEAAERELWTQIDTTQFRNVVVNILENSVKYKTGERVRVTVSALLTDGAARVVFADDGPGVPDEYLPKLFGLFFRGDPSRGSAVRGSGLGLAISAKAVERFGGRVHAEKAPDGGLAIIVTLPLDEA